MTEPFDITGHAFDDDGFSDGRFNDGRFNDGRFNDGSFNDDAFDDFETSQSEFFDLEQALQECSQQLPRLPDNLRQDVIGSSMTAFRRVWILQRMQLAAIVFVVCSLGSLVSGYCLTIWHGGANPPTIVAQQPTPVNHTSGSQPHDQTRFPSRQSVFSAATCADEWTWVEATEMFRVRNLNALYDTFWE